MAIIRASVVLAISLVAATVAHLLFEPHWHSAFVEGRRFSSSVEWWNPYYMVRWIYTALLAFVFGAAVAFFIRSRLATLSAALFGLAFGFICMLLASWQLAAEATLVDRLWIYGDYYLVAPIAALCAALVV